MNTFDVKQIDSLSYWPIKDSTYCIIILHLTICINTHRPLHAKSLRFNLFQEQSFLN